MRREEAIEDVELCDEEKLIDDGEVRKFWELR